MVLTEGVEVTGTGHRRRRVLGAAVGSAVSATTLSGCGLFDDDPAPPAAPDALQPLLDESLALAAAYDRALAAEPGLRTRLTPLAADHRAHAAELAKVIGRAVPSAAAAPAAGADVLAGLRAAELAAQKSATAAGRQAPADRVMLVASIAACRATHAEALR
jgi:hypothetical protein